MALWLGVLSPLALFSFVSSGHNDALMLGLLVAGIALGTAGRLRTGVALCALAATIKLPAPPDGLPGGGRVHAASSDPAGWRVVAEGGGHHRCSSSWP